MKLDWKMILKVLAWILTAIAGGAGGAAMMNEDAGIEIQADGTIQTYGTETAGADALFLCHVVERLETPKNPGLPEYKLPEGFHYTRDLVFVMSAPRMPTNKQMLYEAKSRFGAVVASSDVVSVSGVDKYFLGVQPAPGAPIENQPEEKE